MGAHDFKLLHLSWAKAHTPNKLVRVAEWSWTSALSPGCPNNVYSFGPLLWWSCVHICACVSLLRITGSLKTRPRAFIRARFCTGARFLTTWGRTFYLAPKQITRQYSSPSPITAHTAITYHRSTQRAKRPLFLYLFNQIKRWINLYTSGRRLSGSERPGYSRAPSHSSWVSPFSANLINLSWALARERKHTQHPDTQASCAKDMQIFVGVAPS